MQIRAKRSMDAGARVRRADDCVGAPTEGDARRVRLRLRRWSVIATTTAALVATAAGCSGDDAAGPTTAMSTSPDSAPIDESTTSTTAAEPTTTQGSVDPTTSTSAAGSPTSTTVDASPTSTVAEPTTTQGSGDPTVDAVTAAYRAVFDSWTTCVSTLPNCDLAALAPHRDQEYLLFAQQQAGVWNDGGFSTDGADQRRLTIEDVQLEPDGTTAVVRACEIDPTLLINAADEVVNDEYQTTRQLARLTLSDGEWKIVGVEVIESGTSPEDAVCDA